MSQVVFNSFKSLYNYYYEVGKNWTSPNQAMPEKGYPCDIKYQIGATTLQFEKASFTKNGWVTKDGIKIIENLDCTIIEWKYVPKAESYCQIL